MGFLNLIILTLVAIVQLVNSQFGGGGPSTFGYDASSACSKPYSRNGRSSYEKLPCDFQRQSWCAVAGNTYPWHAVRRFVQENQGLMRRMYGDEKHINVLKTEIDKNDIESDYEDKYHKFFGDSRKYEYDNDDNEEYQGREFQNKLPAFQEYTKPHFRPTESTIKSSSESLKISTSSTSTSTTTTPSTSSIATTTTPTPSSSTTTTTTNQSTTLSTEKIPDKLNKTVDDNLNEKIQTNRPPVTLSDIAKVRNSSFNEIPGSLGAVKENDTSTTESFNLTDNWFDDETTLLQEDGTARTPTTMPIDRVDVNIDSEKDKDEKDNLPLFNNEQQKFRPRPEYHHQTENKPATSMEGQFFQDVAAKDPPVLKLRGINACPVKEEVVAPFWANNTRGEVLALLNLPPFEQYVHWEKCTHANKQMYCRDGCRCEQQYRLHRLLAYDPNNECRGIFSDWFKFPSCCVCRCYDIELRVTSRSPRNHKKKFKPRNNRLK
ncbi:hypothetical protein HCN44_009157 [Aphidius gifuensis]|uniref:Spaetzle domain-containing protein n=1 Tax=Aphidius gifuensis TaxID=684658 RepID=A0A835CVY5_APHGI|nr:hypothetical protein HCN44_009157 [Aphidius gifuensis]